MGLLDSLFGALGGDSEDETSSGADDRDGRPPEGPDETDVPSLPDPAALVERSPAIHAAEPIGSPGSLLWYEATVQGEWEEGRIEAAELIVAPSDDPEVASAFRERRGTWIDGRTTPNVVDVVATGDDPRPWLATRGGDHPRVTTLSDLSVARRLAVVTEIAAALGTAEVGNRRHWDMTPVDVHVVDPEAPIPGVARADVGEFAAVGDWGLRRAVAAAAGSGPGPTPYEAPEQIAPDRFDPPEYMSAHVPNPDRVDNHIDLEPRHGESKPWIDAYRFGAVAYYVLTGEAPFDVEADSEDRRTAILAGDVTPPTEIDPDLPGEVDELVAASMSIQPEDRPMAGWLVERYEDLFEAET